MSYFNTASNHRAGFDIADFFKNTMQSSTSLPGGSTGGSHGFSQKLAELLMASSPAPSTADATVSSGPASEATQTTQSTLTSSTRQTSDMVSEHDSTSRSQMYHENIIPDYLQKPGMVDKSLEELAENLEDDFATYAKEASQPYIEAGVPFVSFQSGFVVYCIEEPIPLPQVTRGDGTFDFAASQKAFAEYNAELERRRQPEYLEMVKERETLLRELMKQRNKSGDGERLSEEIHSLSARAALVKAGETIDGFTEQYNADPAATAAKYADELNDLVSSVRVTVKDGEIAYHF